MITHCINNEEIKQLLMKLLLINNDITVKVMAIIVEIIL